MTRAEKEEPMNREQMEKEAREWSEQNLATSGCYHLTALTDFALAMVEKQRKEDAKIAEDFANLYSNEPNHISQRTADAIASAIRGQKEE